LAAVAVTPAGTTLAVNDGPAVRLWDVIGKRRAASLLDPGLTGLPAALTFSPDGKTLAVGNRDRQVVLWDLATSTRRVLPGHTEAVTALAFSRDGKTLASGGSDHTVRLWHVATGQDLAVLEGHHGPVYALAFSPDGHTLASGGEREFGRGEVYFWHTERKPAR
jgi:WD40 repeat protein